MARPLRIDLAGGWYHVTHRGIERRPIFRADRDREHFVELLGLATDRFAVRLHAFVLMDNHYHLVIETPTANLSALMQWLNVSYSIWFNRRHGRVGPLFQGRFKAVLAEPGAYAVELSRYVHLNPVRIRAFGLDKTTQARAQAGLATKQPTVEMIRERLQRLREYRWSSYRAYAGLVPAPAWLVTETVLGLCGGGTAIAQRAQYRDFVEAAVREGLPASPWERLEAGLLLGGAEFMKCMRRLAKGDRREQPQLKRMDQRPSLAAAVAAVEEMQGRPWREFRDEHGDWGRDAVLWLGRTCCGLKLGELAKFCGISTPAAVTVAVNRLEARLANDRDLREHLSKVRADMLNVKT